MIHIEKFLAVFREGRSPNSRTRAQNIVRSVAQHFGADISTLFLVEGKRLVLAGGISTLSGEEIPLPESASYSLSDAAAELEKSGLTVSVVKKGKPLFVESFAKLKDYPAHLGKWNDSIYPDPEGVEDLKTGFGCLYAVPLSARSPEYPKGRVIGVFKIERRCSRPIFSEEDRVAFDITARHMSEILSRATDESVVPTAEKKFEALKINVNALAPENPATTAPAEVADLVRRCQRGFASLKVNEKARRDALENLERWLTDAIFEEYRPQLKWMIEAERWALVLDSFFRVIPFGTGGRRGPVGIGTNRFNPITLAGSIQGHAQFLLDFVDSAERSVVVAYDVRSFHDLRESYNPNLPNPLLGLTSRDFAQIAAEVYSAMNIKVYMPEESFEGYVSTPELSFAIRRLGASAGLNISASHNHPDDNGGKFYNELGSQHVPPGDEEMAQLVEDVRYLAKLERRWARAAGLLVDIPPEVHQAYIQLNLDQSLDSSARSERVVFTPLHGAGTYTVGEVLKEAGFKIDLVPEQSTSDGRFPAVPFRAPNPEVPESMAMGIELARQIDAGLVMACDPDADRIGVCAHDGNGDYRFFNGNEIAVLVTHFKLERLRELGRLPERPLVVKTEVTTELLGLVIRAFGGTLDGDLLVGFKYHGQVLERIEKGTYGGGFQLTDFITGVEESHGVLVTPEVRDKDAAGASILLAELASRLRDQGRSLSNYLDDIYKRYGYHANCLVSLVMAGAEGLANLHRIQETFRNRAPEQIAGRRVLSVADHWDVNGIHGKMKSEITDRASRDMLVFGLEDGARLLLRPSGTEPKSKTYVELAMPPLGIEASDAALAKQKQEADEITREIADDLTRQMLEIIDVRLPRWAFRISGLVGLDERIDFAEGFIPELMARAERVLAGNATRADATDWVKNRLAPYGKDAPALVAGGVKAFFSERRGATSDPTERRVLDEAEAIFPAES